MKTIIFSAKNEKGEMLIDIAGRQGEIWTARRKTSLEEGDKVRLKRSRTGRHEYEGIVEYSHISPVSIDKYVVDIMWEHFYKKAGFHQRRQWIQKFRDITGTLWPEPLGIVYFIHITNIQPVGG